MGPPSTLCVTDTLFLLCAFITLSAGRQTRIVDQVVIGTHGSLKNWMSKRVLNVSALKILVFDEADEMLKVRFGVNVCI